jgi:hypothetical protein
VDASSVPAFTPVDLALLIAEAVPKVNLTKRRAWQRRDG